MASTVRKDLFLSRKLYSAVEKEDIWACEHYLKLGANPNLLLPEGLTALHLAAGWDADCAKSFVKLMLDHGGNPNVRSSDGLTPLHVSAMWGKTSLLKLLLQAGGNPHLTEEDGKNAWDLAREADQEDVLRMLDYFDPLSKTKLSLSSLFLGEDLFLVKKTKSSENVVLPKTPVFAPPTCCQHLPSDDSTCSTPAETSFRVRQSTSDTALSNSLNVSSWHLERFMPERSRMRKSDPYVANRSVREVDPQDAYAQLELQSVSESYDKMQQMSNQDTVSRSYTTCDEGPSWNLKKAIGQVVSTMLLPVEETRYHSTADEVSCTSSEEVVSCDPNTKQHLCGVIAQNEMHFSVSSFDNPLDIATYDQRSFATSSPTGEHSNSSKEKQLQTFGKVKPDLISSYQTAHNLPGPSGQSLFPSMTELQNRLKENGASADKELKINGIRKANPNYQNLPQSISGLQTRVRNGSTVAEQQLDVTSEKQDKRVTSTQSKMDSSLNKNFSNVPASQNNAKHIEKFVYTDTELNVSFIEHRFPSFSKSLTNSSVSSASGDTTVIYNWQQFRSDSSDVSGSSLYEAVCVSPSLEKLSNSQIRAKLIAAGDSPGPVMDSTRALYLLRLARLQQKPLQHKVHDGNENAPQYCKELMNVIDGKLNIHIMKDLELKMNKAFEQPNQVQPWREGQVKNCFSYLLLDPRVTKDLPGRALSMSEADRMKTFLASIFYIGKGKRTRPYSHLYEAAQYLQKPQNKPNNKVQHILDIWSAGEGVVSLLCFQNVIPVEAYTREACMVETIGLDNVTNIRRGDYYGVVTRWPREKRQRLGAYLLYRAYNILLNEGERQIKPADM